MSKEFSFSVMPSVSISRSRFARKSQHKTTFNLGQLIPIYCDEVLPGDTRSIDVASLVRMSTPIAPIMDNIYMDIFAFFVPNRIVWDHWKAFMGENETSYGFPSSNYSVPYLFQNSNLTVQSGSNGDYMGLPVGIKFFGSEKVSCLPFRGLAKIYNRWFRDENVIAPLAVQTGDTNEVLVGEANLQRAKFACDAGNVLKVAKLADYFTKALPYAQKGTAVSIPLGTTAPVVTGTDRAFVSGQQALIFKGTLNQSLSGGDGLGYSGTGQLINMDSTGHTTSGVSLYPSNLYADLSTATAATINQLRYAFQLQKLLEKDCMGSRYWEILANHFGVTAPDASLQDPEYLGGTRVNINIDQVLSTAQTQVYDGEGVSTSGVLGQPGANSVTANKGSLFTKSFVEHGHIIIVACVRHDATYGQGINRMWTRQGRYDYYWPVFANLGAQEVKNREIFVSNSASDNNGTFGYQEAWAEYRYKPSICTGLLRPGVSNNLGFWTLSENFASLPTLGQTFIEQSRDNISRALVTSSSGPDFIADFYFRDIAVRPMPVYSIPGLIDHH